MQGSSGATSDPGAPLSPEALPAQWSLALPALAVSGATDWADGWAARRFNQPSVIGSYLDPLADKVLICSVVGALGWSVSGPAPPVAPSCPELPGCVPRQSAAWCCIRCHGDALEPSRLRAVVRLCCRDGALA